MMYQKYVLEENEQRLFIKKEKPFFKQKICHRNPQEKKLGNREKIWSE